MREYSLAFPVNRYIKIYLVRFCVLTIEEKNIYLSNWNSRRKKIKNKTKQVKTNRQNHLFFSVLIYTGKLSCLLRWVNKGLRINICFWYDIISWLVNNMMGIKKNVAYTGTTKKSNESALLIQTHNTVLFPVFIWFSHLCHSSFICFIGSTVDMWMWNTRDNFCIFLFMIKCTNFKLKFVVWGMGNHQP